MQSLLAALRFAGRSKKLPFAACAVVLLVAIAAASRAAPAGRYAVEEASVADLQSALGSGKTTSERLVRAYLARIAAIDAGGPALRSIISLNERALADARDSDAERRAGKVRGPLHGIPIVIKDNIETGDGTATTAGSDALAANVTRRDAPLVRRLKDAGAIVLGKTNLSEWANIRSAHSISGWSALGGLVKNPYALDRNACGSSSGTGAAIAASLAAAGVGTETDGSITCPSATNGIVGLKPTVGLVSRTYVVPISHSQDTPGPMGRTVADVAALLTALAGSDPKDAATKDADKHKLDYVAALAGASLSQMRLGVLSFSTGGNPALDDVFAQAVATLKARGATVVALRDFKPDPSLGDDELTVLLTELKIGLNDYLATTPATVKTRTLADVIAFNRAHPRELSLFGQDLFEKAEGTKGSSDPGYVKARANSLRHAGVDGIDKLVIANKLDALIAPSYGPAWRTDTIVGDNTFGAAATLPAIAGYPHLTVPMGYVRGMPVGISFIGRPWSEARLLKIGAAYERAAAARRPPTYAPSIETTPAMLEILAPER